MPTAGFSGVRPSISAGFTPALAAPPRADVLGTAIAGAKKFRDTLGLPSYADLFKQFGGGQGTTEFGNAGAAREGMDLTRGELTNWRNTLAAQQGNIEQARRGVRNPTGTEGFQNVMRLQNERIGNAAEQADRLANEAASRRGFVGGYNPERTERDRLETLATAGYDAVDAERKAQQDLLGSEVSLYGAEMPGYTSSLGAYSDLTRSYAELPTKYMTALSGLLSGLGGYGDIFGTALKGAMYEDEPSRLKWQEEAKARDEARQFDYGQRGAAGDAARREAAAQADFQRQQQAEQARREAEYRAQGRDPFGRPYGPANPFRG